MAFTHRVDDPKKLCPACGQNKGLEYFYSHPTTRDRLSTKCKQCSREYISSRRLTKGTKSWYYRRWHKLKRNAVLRGAVFRLDIEEFRKLRDAACYYCGGKFDKMSIDRVDPTQGYTPYNCVSCCIDCNLRKGAMTVTMCRQVIEFVDTLS